MTGLRALQLIALVPLTLVQGPACRNGDRAASLASAPKGRAIEGAGGEARQRVAELYFSTGVGGMVEPCGCTSKPLGGLPRLATVIHRGRKERGLIDAGSFLFPPEGLSETTHAQHVLKSHVLARAYRMLGAIAINVGESDLAGGADLLKELQREGAVPFVSANVRPVSDTGPSIAQSFVREIGGIRIGVTGVATPERVKANEGVTAIEHALAVRSEVASLKKRGAELIVVLANLGDQGARELAREVPEIDVIVRAPGTPITQAPAGPMKVGDTIVVEAGSQGQYIGRLTLVLERDAPVRPLSLDDGGYRAKKQRELVERKIQAYRREIESWGYDPAKAEAVAARKAEVARLIASSHDDPGATASSTGKAGGVARIELVPLSEDVAPDPAMADLLNGYYAQLRDMNLSKGDPKLCEKKDNAPAYVGTEKCIECHEAAGEFWKKTKHASAWATLAKANKHFDLTCIGCHTVGYQKPGGFCRLSEVGSLKDVGCEMCHGPGSLHSQDGEKLDTISLAAPESTCSSGCHVPEHSDTFEYQRYVREITGKGHEMRSKPSGGG